MKKIFILIVTILGIGVSICSAGNSCTTISNNSNSTQYNARIGVSFIYDKLQEYAINSFSFYVPSELTFSEGLKFCVTNFSDDFASWGNMFDAQQYVFPAICTLVNYNSFFSNGVQTITLTSPYILSGNYNYFYIAGRLSSSPLIPIYKNSFGVASTFDDYFSFIRIGNEGLFSIHDFCYSVGGTPKLKINYGNTSYEYELEDNLSIYLKSPVTQSGNTFTYAGSTGINLYFNNTSQFYNKSNLYLESMYWFNNNIFTPICL